MTTRIRVEETSTVMTVWIDNPAKRNAMDKAMWIALGEAMDRAAAQPALRCVVVRGVGGQAFGSGADIDEFRTERADAQQAAAFAADVHGALDRVRACPVPTIAAIEGVCVGGGLELAALCDLRLCNASGRFAVPIARLGATLAYAELDGLQRLVGPSTALELLLEGRTFDAQEAYAKGLVNRVIDNHAFDEELAATVARICAGAPLSARLHKTFVRRLQDPTPLSSAEIAQGLSCFDTEDYRIGRDAFLAKTRPSFVGR